MGFKLYLTQFFNFNSNFIFDTFTQSRTNLTRNPLPPVEPYSFNQTSYFSTETLLLTRSLSKAVYSLNQLRDLKHFESLFSSPKIKTETPIEFLLFETVDFGYIENFN